MTGALSFSGWTVLLLSAKAGLVLAAAYFCTRRLSRSAASARHRVWVVALTMSLLIPSSLLLPVVELPVLSSSAPIEEPVDDTQYARFDFGPATHPSDSDSADAKSHSATGRDTPWFELALALYAVGVLVIAGSLLLGIIRASRIKRHARPANTHPLWRHALRQCDRTLHKNTDRSPSSLSTRASLLVSDAIASPVTFGVLRPTVLLPADVSDWSEAHRHNAIIHELEHVSRADWLTQLVGVLACALYWFHPLVWFGSRRLHLEAERACDERVLALGSDPQDYAQQLVDLTRQAHRSPLASAVAMANRSELADRVYSVLQSRRNPMQSHRSAKSLAVLVVGLGVGVASIVPTHATSPVTTVVSMRLDDTDDVTPLMQAARDGDLSQVESLITRGADLEADAGGSFTALILASARGHADVVEALLDAGADVDRSVHGDWRDDLQRTALVNAARNGHRSVVEALLDAGAGVDYHGVGDASALMEACAHEHYRIAKLLIDHGADVNLKIRGDGNAAIAAARDGNLKMLKLLVESGADVTAGVPGDANPLILAVRNGDRPMVEYLLAHGADPSAYVPGDENALVAAAESGDRSMVRLLMNSSQGD